MSGAYNPRVNPQSLHYCAPCARGGHCPDHSPRSRP